MDKLELFESVKDPAVVGVGDYVIIRGACEPVRIDILKIRECRHRGFFKLEGRGKNFRRNEFVAPSEAVRREYIRREKYFIAKPVGPCLPTGPMPKFPGDDPNNHNCVRGRSTLEICDIEASRTPSNYVDVRFRLLNVGEEPVVLKNFDWGDVPADSEWKPFAYASDIRQVVFQVECGGMVFPEGFNQVRVVVSNQAVPGYMNILIPSEFFGGALGTFSMIECQVPPFVTEVEPGQG